MEKKHDGRFTIQFNTKDPRQSQAAQKLNRQGRRKAQFLTEAILRYDLSYAKTNGLQCGGEEDHELEIKILHVLQKYGIGASLDGRGKTASTEQGSEEENNTLMDDSIISAITKTLSAFAGIPDE